MNENHRMTRYRMNVKGEFKRCNGYGRWIYRDRPVQKFRRRCQRWLRRYFCGSTGYGRRIYRHNIPGAVTTGIPVLLIILMAVLPSLFTSKPSSSPLFLPYIGHDFVIHQHVYLSTPEAPGKIHVQRNSKGFGDHLQRDQSTDGLQLKYEPDRDRVSSKVAALLNPFVQDSHSACEPVPKMGPEPWSLDDEEIRARWRDYNRAHVNDPLRGYHLTPQSVSLTYEMQNVHGAKRGALRRKILEEHEKAWPPDSGRRRQLVIPIESKIKNQLLIPLEKNNQIPQISIEGKKNQ